MEITPIQKRKIESVINVFETSKIEGNYGAVTIMPDGPILKGKQIKQITYGRSQVTEFGNLNILVQNYIDANGKHATDFKPYLKRIGAQPSLRTNGKFKALLKTAATDPIMKDVQDEFFDKNYYIPAKEWCEINGFTLPLALLTVYDSFIHSGQVRDDIRNKFEEKTPINGGNEIEWLAAYIAARRNWLSSRSNVLVRKSVYRMDCLFSCIENQNFDLSKPIVANGIIIK